MSGAGVPSGSMLQEIMDVFRQEFGLHHEDNII